VLRKNLNPSTKVQGKHELHLISVVTNFFRERNFDVVNHISFNIAWGRIISDLDILLIKNNEISYIEVKSKKDKIKKAYEQIERVKDYIDYAWIASDKRFNSISNGLVGYIEINNDETKIVKEPKRFISEPSFSSILSLKKKCLLKFDITNNLLYQNILKYDIAKKVYNMKNVCTRDCLKEIVTCGGNCDDKCPIDTYVKNHN